jgi:hypothetical protein
MTTTDETYNGWTNRETWAVSLHLGNNQGRIVAHFKSAFPQHRLKGRFFDGHSIGS